ncbi:uncharacterized protein LOC113399208 [Vanessa tameamea]|uniref:Uncharacterized protein LOC113399208 n=1 Tax=Vanessa tameamea TaxID=334116 RepID=A0A8B8IAH4_VANTA
MCIEPVIPVWTFVFQLQNCTERYGCPAEWRSNRFVSYERCMRRCKPLVNLYTEILANDTQNLSTYLRSKSWASSGRRDIDAEDDPELDEDIKRESVKGPAPDPLDDDLDYKYRQLTPDIDDVDSEITQVDMMRHLYSRN